jgi:hypothetical protein
MVGGAEYSRHMYGDAFDISPLEVSLNQLEEACVAIGGKLVEYSTHAHCDFRYDAVDPLLFGVVAEAPPPDADAEPAPGYDATIVVDGEQLRVVSLGFGEGTPRIRWIARGDAGQVLERATAESFVPPAEATSVEAIVGGQVTVNWSR